MHEYKYERQKFEYTVKRRVGGAKGSEERSSVVGRPEGRATLRENFAREQSLASAYVLCPSTYSVL